MSELPLTPFPAPAGPSARGDETAGVCVDGVCFVPEDADPAAAPRPAGPASSSAEDGA